MPEPPPNASPTAAPALRPNGSNGHTDRQPVLITGGAGFVGTNMAARLAGDGRRVRIFDSLARPGVEANLQWLTDTFPDHVEVQLGDVRNTFAVRHAVRDAAAVFHFAAQVAVTTSLTGPMEDFEVNLRGTVNLLEAIRARPTPPPLLFTSTNKVYGNLHDVPLEQRGNRYEPVDSDIRAHGISEARPLDFHSPYGCSKGAADQYVLDYARSYDLPAVVFRMSCIYGPHQFGTEDQGWVAHFLIRALQGEPITLFGDGYQVRDILFVEDLVEAMLGAMRRLDVTSGRAFNVGGGPVNTTSLIELLDTMGEVLGEEPDLRFADWRQGDQRYYVADTRALEAATGWLPTVGIREGVGRLHDWLAEHHAALAPSTS